jgi:hypothetical protein
MAFYLQVSGRLNYSKMWLSLLTNLKIAMNEKKATGFSEKFVHFSIDL